MCCFKSPIVWVCYSSNRKLIQNSLNNLKDRKLYRVFWRSKRFIDPFLELILRTSLFWPLRFSFWIVFSGPWCYGEVWMYNQCTNAQSNELWQLVLYVKLTQDILQMQGSFQEKDSLLNFSNVPISHNSNMHSLGAAKWKQEYR